MRTERIVQAGAIFGVYIAISILTCTLATPVRGQEPVQDMYAQGFAREIPLDSSDRLNAIKYLQCRIVQPDEGGRYFVRSVKVLIPEGGEEGVFSYMVTFQGSVPENKAYDVGDFYSVCGYYLVQLTRSGDEFTLVDEIDLTPRELADRLTVLKVPAPPEITSDPARLDFTDAIFDASDPSIAEWRNQLAETVTPRWDWRDMTGDGILDCILDIEGFESRPTSYYLVLVTVSDGFIEGFRSWGYDTDFSEMERDGTMVVRADRYSLNSAGDFLPSWREYYIWNGSRYILANLNFADEYSELVSPLLQLASDSLAAETDPQSRWAGMPRFRINLARFSESLGMPSVFYFNLARVEEYQNQSAESLEWWRTLREYLDGEYDSESQVDVDEIDPALQDWAPIYREWRDELYSAAEAALEDE